MTEDKRWRALEDRLVDIVERAMTPTSSARPVTISECKIGRAALLNSIEGSVNRIEQIGKEMKTSFTEISGQVKNIELSLAKRNGIEKGRMMEAETSQTNIKVILSKRQLMLRYGLALLALIVIISGAVWTVAHIGGVDEATLAKAIAKEINNGGTPNE